VCVVDAPWGSRVHLDAGGTLAAVHATDREVVASTTTLLQAVLEGPDFERPSVDDFPADRQNQFFPGGLTHLPWAQRLLPNHHLDLGEWSARRHWPLEDIAAVDELGLVTELQRISGGIGTVMRALAGSFDLHLGLTAGRDSRVLLACGRDVRDSISTFTFDYGADVPGSTVDVAVARELARRAGVPHAVIPVDEPSAGDRADYLFAIGHAGHWGKCRDFGAIGTPPQDERSARAGVPRWARPRALLVGDAQAAGRADTRGPAPPAPPARRSRFLPRDGGSGPAAFPRSRPDSCSTCSTWSTVAGAGPAPTSTGRRRSRPSSSPSRAAKCSTPCSGSPVEYRVKKRLYDDLVRMAWPELLDLPFQALPDGTS
jgi:hypothetical protein